MATMPRVGDMVHYRSYGTPGGEYVPECRAAIVTGIASDTDEPILNLAVVNPTGLFFNTAVYAPQSAESNDTGGTWHYQCPPTEENR